MIKPYPLLLAVMCLCLSPALGQPNSALPKNIRAANTLENLFDANGLSSFDNLYGIPLEPGTVMGDAYLNPEWKRTTLLLYDVDKMIEGYPTRYEIDEDQFEIKSSTGIKVLNGRKVKSFVWIDSLTKAPHYFLNGRDFANPEGVRMSGFYEVLVEGQLTLLGKTLVVVKEPTYNEKLDMGQRNTRIIKRTIFFYLDNGTLKEVPSSRKKLLPIFGDQADEMEDFLRVNKLTLNEAAHLRALFEHYNGRIVTN